MRILVDLQSLHTPERQRGIGIAAAGLARTLLQHLCEHQFHLARKPGAAWEFAEVPAPAPDLEQVWANPVFWRVAEPAEYLRRAQIDLLYVTSALMSDIALPPVPAGVRLACQVHDLIPLLFPEQYWHRWPADLQADYRTRLRYVAGADLLLCDSQATADDVARHLQPAGKVLVSYLSATYPFVALPREQARAESARYLGWREPYVVAVSGWDYRKNNGAILAGFAAAALPQHRLVLLGIRAPAHVSALHQLAAQHGLTGRIAMPPFMPAQALNSLYSGADLALFPSLYEGFGLPVLESLLCGVPVVAGNNSCLPEILGKGGLLVEATDAGAIGAAVRAIALDPAQRADLARNGLHHARQFTWEAVGERLRAAFATLSATS